MKLYWVGGEVMMLLLWGCGSNSGSYLFSGGKDTTKADASVDAGENHDAGGPVRGTGGAANEGGTRGSDGAPAAGGESGNAHGTATRDSGSSGDGGAGGTTATTGGLDGSTGAAPAGKDAGSPDADAGREMHGTPHSVACGAAACDVSASHFPVQACCVGPIEQVAVCLPLTPQGCGRVGSLLTCDDATDCQSGQICCLDVTGNGFAGFCSVACTVQQLCRQNAECRNGLSCHPLDLRPEYGGCR